MGVLQESAAPGRSWRQLRRASVATLLDAALAGGQCADVFSQGEGEEIAGGLGPSARDLQRRGNVRSARNAGAERDI